MANRLLETLERLGLADLHDLLSSQDVDADLLDALSDDDLREIGLSLGQRMRFRRAINPPVSAREAQEPVQPTTSERRQLTALFCDLVGSTKLATELDPEDLQDVIQSYQALCADVIAAQGGHVAYSQGDGLMAYFGFPVAGEDDPERAIRAGLALCAEVARLKTAAPSALAARVGIATGVVVIGAAEDGVGGNVVGETPNLASRLQNVAAPGEVIIAEATRRLGQAMFDVESRGALELKGFGEPVTVYRVVGESAAPSRFEAKAKRGLNAMVGRDAELLRLRRVWRSALGGEGGMALISGEAGIGKSRLARAFIESLPYEGQRVIKWHCAAHLTNRPLHPVAREIERSAGITPTQSGGARRAALAAHVAQVSAADDAGLPWLDDLLGLQSINRPDLDAPARAKQLNEVLLSRIAAIAAKNPTLILLEDAHWADAATLDLLNALVPRLAEASVMLLVTHRPNFTPPWKPEDIRAAIALEGIAPSDGERLLGMVAEGRKLPPAVVQTILEKAGGVPLFVEELTKTVLDAISDGDKVLQGSGGHISIPATLQDSLMARLDRLGAAKELAQLGSVIGREFSADMLRVILPEKTQIDSDLDRLCASGLAFKRSEDAAGMIVFHHALIQDAAYEALLKKRRREVHRSIAEAMLAGHEAFAGAEPETIARHCSRGGLDEGAMQHWLLAGLHALDRAANGPALTYLRSALEHLESLPQDAARAETELKIQMALAPATMAIEGWAAPAVERACVRARSLAVELGHPASLFGATWGLWTNYFLRGEMNPAQETAREVDMMAEGANQDVLRVAADHAVGFTQYFRGELDDSLARADRGIGLYNEDAERYIVREFQFSSTTALHGYRAAAFWMKGRDDEASASLKRALDLPDHLGHAPSMAFSLAFSQYTLMYMRNWQRVRQISLRLIQLSELEGFRMWIPQANVFIGLCDAAEGKLDRGLQHAFESFDDYVRTGTGLTLSQLVPSLAEFLIAAGHPDDAVARLDSMINAVTQRQELAYGSELYRIRAKAKLALDAGSEARADAETALKIARDQGANALVARALQTLDTVELARASSG